MRGLYYEEFEIGGTFEHALRRTVTEMDNTLFSALTHNPQPLHIDHHFAAATEWDTAAGQLAVHARPDDRHFRQRYDDRHHHRQSRHDRCEISQARVPRRYPARDDRGRVAKRESKSRADAGLVEFHHRMFNQRNELVAECRRQAFMRKRPKEA